MRNGTIWSWRWWVETAVRRWRPARITWCRCRSIRGPSRRRYSGGWLPLRLLISHPLEPDDPLPDRRMRRHEIGQKSFLGPHHARRRIYNAEVGGALSDGPGRVARSVELLER